MVMIKSLKGTIANALASGNRPKGFPGDLIRRSENKLAMIEAAASLKDLLVPPGNRLEALKGGRAGQHSIRINDQWRVCFVWNDDGAEDVEIVDYH
jgi:proteic killer suppression protein